jgi:hypothetical protein
VVHCLLGSHQASIRSTTDNDVPTTCNVKWYSAVHKALDVTYISNQLIVVN